MSLFTLAYVSRVGLFGFAALMIQGALVLISWTLSQRATTTASVELRFRLSCAHFAALLILPALSIAILNGCIAHDAQRAVGQAPPFASVALNRGSHDPIALAVALGLVWLVGLVIMLLRLAMEIHRAVSRPVEPAALSLTSAVGLLAEGWVRVPIVVRSPHIAVPEVRGLWRSFLVTPYNFDELLTASEREAVLLHELAHVRRADFSWNLLQRLVLALVWFHPAAWVLYGWIRREREACCDAMAVRRGADRHALARALVGLADHKAIRTLAMSAANGADLTRRVHRLIGDSRPPTRPSWATFAGGTAVTLCFLSLAVGLQGSRDPLIENLFVASDFGPTILVMAQDAAGSFSLNVRSGRVLGASVGKRRLQRRQIHQSGETVSLDDTDHKAVMTLTVTPSDKVSWVPRR